MKLFIYTLKNEDTGFSKIIGEWRNDAVAMGTVQAWMKNEKELPSFSIHKVGSFDDETLKIEPLTPEQLFYKPALTESKADSISVDEADKLINGE